MILAFATRVVLSPVLVAQALLVVSRALRLPEAAGPRSGSLGSGPPLRLLIVGDSSAAGVGVPHQDQALIGNIVSQLATRHRVDWRLIARTGATTRSTLHELETLDLGPADIVVTALGVNDITRSVPLVKWRGQQRRLRATLRERTGARHIYVSGIPPLGAFPLLPHPLRWVLGQNADRAETLLLADLAHEGDVTYLPMPPTLSVDDMAEDGFHPGPAIYAEWAKEVASRILSDWPETRDPAP